MNFSLNKTILKDRKAYNRFFIETYKDMLKYASLSVDDFAVAEDIVQDSYLVLWEKREVLEIKTSLIGFLKQSIKNKGLNYKRHIDVKLKYEKENEILSDNSEELIDEETANKIRRQMDKIPAASRRVLELNVIHGLKYADIAEDLGISLNTVKYHVKVSFKILRESIKSDSTLIYFLFLLKKINK